MYLFFLMTRYLPISSLFPYTTLFRSVLGVEMCRDRRGIEGAQPPVVDDGGVAVHGALLRDRKSTRLNSSHVAISYAVFCLKKKKIKEHVVLLYIQYYKSTLL